MDIYLDKLELHGFKSFPEKTVIKFHKGITAVIGPNGCGKSNLVDALLWVLGEQRIKNLRGENNEDLIFSGSENKKPLGMTEVGVYFTSFGEDTYMARRFFRTGEGKYIMNEKYCRNKDIQDQLFKLHLGEKNYFIFEQGSIEKLVSLKPSEKRMLIEEAAGISQYLIRKKETAGKLIIAEQNLDNIQILIADKETRLKDLRNQVRFVQRYRETKDNKVNYLKAFLKKKSQFFQTDFQKFKSEIEKIMNQETLFVSDIAAYEKGLLTLEEKRWLLDKELKQNQQKIFDFNKRIISAKNEIDRGRQRKGFIEQKIKETKQTIASNKQEIGEVDKQLEQLDKNILDFEAQTKDARSGYDEAESRLFDLNEKIDTLNRENSGLKNEIFNTQRELSNTGNQLKELDKRMQRVDNEIISKKNFMGELKNQVSVAQIEEGEKKQQQLQAALEEEKVGFAALEEQFKENRDLLDDLKSSLRNQENEIRNLENQRRKYLEIKKKIVGNNQPEEGFEHHGFLQEGVLADKQYHKILENFYFEEMDALMVVRNEDVENSRINKFLLQKLHEEGLAGGIEQEPGFVSFVKDLFNLKNPGLKKFLENGVLVETLKDAIRIFLKYGVRVVTREAETVNTGGILVRSREKGILDVLDEIREIDKQKELLAKEVEQTREKLDVCNRKHPELGQKVSQARTTLGNSEKELLRLDSELSSLRKNRETNLKRVELTESEIKLLLAEKDKFIDRFELLDGQNEKFEKAYKDLTLKRETFQADQQLLREEINKREKEFMQHENAIKLIKEKINSSRHNQKVLANNKNRAQQNILNGEKEILRLGEEVKEIDQLEKIGKEELKEVELKKREMEELVNKKEQEFNTYNREIKEKTANLNQKRKQLEEIKEEKKNLEIDLSSIKKDLFQLEELSFKELNCELRNIDTQGLDEVMEMDLHKLEEDVEDMESRLSKMRDSNRLNFSAESEFEILTQDFNFLLTQKEDVVKSIEDMNEAIRKIDEESRISFMEAFGFVKDSFLKNFRILFEGGDAELSIMDHENVLESGLDIKAQPPGKRLTSLKLLSGGEKTLTSLAFLFALFEYKPSPFCVFDEVDASLDEANIQRFLKFLNKLKTNTQFLIITHNFKTMERADYIYGVSMNEPGISKVYSMKMTGKETLERA